MLLARRSIHKSLKDQAKNRMKKMIHKCLKMNPLGCLRLLFSFKTFAHFLLVELTRTDLVLAGKIMSHHYMVTYLIDMKIYLLSEDAE